ncbi:MAG: flavodoxin family protein [Oscillospiraceae bacterium]|nr:flavodoxin family protein [Oscillospiraceae bacterium]
MKVLLINGSPNEQGCTYTALRTVAEALNENGVETEILYIAAPAKEKYISPCCDFAKADEVLSKAKDADGFVFGSPDHYAAMSSVLKTFMDYFFWMCGDSVRNKPAAAVVSTRRCGASAALDNIYKYFGNASMHIVSTNGWNVVHGNTPAEVEQDEEGLYCMRTLGKNMAWLIKCIKAGEAAGITPPEKEKKPRTSFIR